MTAGTWGPADELERGRHLPDQHLASWVSRLRPAVFAQSALLLLLAALAWPASLGGAFGVVAIAGRSMEPTYELGEVVITWRQPVELGDVVLYRVPEGSAGAGNPVIHRVIGGDRNGWITQGDNVGRPDPWRPAESDMLGVARFRAPIDGRLIGLFRSWWVVALTGSLAIALFLWPDSADGDRPVRGRHRP